MSNNMGRSTSIVGVKVSVLLNQIKGNIYFHLYVYLDVLSLYVEL